MEHQHARPDEGVVPWFYRTRRNAAIDRLRRQGAANRAMDAEICACESRLARTLKAEYAEALQAIDVDGTSVKAFAISTA